MYGSSRNRYGGNWYQAVFWFAIGLIVGQFFRFDITFQDSDRTQLQPTQTQIAQLQDTQND